MRIHVGTSGFGYPAWRGRFYPEDLKQKEFLRYYGTRFDTVEINNTFYRMPTPKTVAAWPPEVPETFRFGFKAPQRITHMKRLAGASEDVAFLFETLATVGAKLGPVLFQLPPFFKKDAARLGEFLAALPAARPALAFEFRHVSWFDDEIFDVLRRHGVALCVAEEEERAAPLVTTAAHGYLRLRRLDYEEATLHAWAEKVRGQPWQEAWVYFKHEEEAKGPALAARFAELVR